MPRNFFARDFANPLVPTAELLARLCSHVNTFAMQLASVYDAVAYSCYGLGSSVTHAKGPLKTSRQRP